MPKIKLGTVWKDIVGYERVYQVSDYGDVKRVMGGQGAQPNKILSQPLDNVGYRGVHLHRNGHRQRFRTHYLVICAFIGPKPSPKHEVRHLDGCKTNNHHTNLMWGTRQENTIDAIKHGTATIGTKNAGAKLTKTDIRQIRRLLSHSATNTAIAKQFDVSQPTISDIKTGKSYKDV